jgi:hypothetical protein
MKTIKILLFRVLNKTKESLSTDHSSVEVATRKADQGIFHILRDTIIPSDIHNILLLAKVFHSIYVISIFIIANVWSCIACISGAFKCEEAQTNRT